MKTFFYKFLSKFNRRLQKIIDSRGVIENEVKLLNFSLWPEGIPKKIKAEGIPIKYSSYFKKAYRLGMNLNTYIFKKEAILGRCFEKGNVHELSSITKEENVVIPICLPGETEKKTGDIKFKVDNKEISIEQTKRCRWRYYNITEGLKSVRVESKNCNIIVGEPLVKKLLTKESEITQQSQNQKHPKLVLCIVVDSLSQFALREENQASLLNTKRFFRNGRIFENNYTQAEWTLPSTASIMSGLYTSNHCLYEPKVFANFDETVGLTTTLSDEIPLMAEWYRNAGYLTFLATGGWRINPLYGFSRGFDRYLYYGNNDYSPSDKQLVDDAIEQLKAFPDRNQFIYLHLNKLHSQDPLYLRFSDEINFPLKSLKIKKPDGKINRLHYPEICERYERMLNQVDQDLEPLYEFVEGKFQSDEVVVCLFADHGVIYISDDTYMLSEAMTNVPLMVKSNGLPAGRDKKFSQLVDLYPSILKLSNVSPPRESMDGRVWSALGGDEREYAISESIYPNNYMFKLRDDKFIFRLTANVTRGIIEVDNAKLQLLKIKEGNNFNCVRANENNEKMKSYFAIAKKQIQNIQGDVDFF